jgi:predicted acyl esterase
MIKIYRIFILILLFTLEAQSQSYKDNDFEISRNNFRIKLRDNIKLECTSFTPNTDKPINGFPCIVYCHGYGKSKEDNLSNAIIFSKAGFVTYTYSMRGQGNSEGESNLISKTEAEDLKEVIDYIKEDALVDKKRIVVIGSSQGGIIPLMALCNGLDVKCTISDLISFDFASNWISNGCIKMSLLWSLSYPVNIVRYNSEVTQYRNWILSKKRDKWDSLEYYLPRKRDFSSQISNNKIPIFISNSFQDKYFSSNSIIENISSFSENSKFYFGAIEGHGSSTSEDEISYHDKSMNEWIDYWLNKSEPEAKSKFVFSLSSLPLFNNNWTFQRLYSDSSLYENPNRIKFYFHPSKIVTELPYYGNTNSFIFKNTVNDSSCTMRDAVNSEFKGYDFESKFKKENIVFDSEMLIWNYNALGIPKLHLVYKSTKSVCQFNFQIFEVFIDGTSKFVSSINYTDRNCEKNKRKEVDIDGNALGHIFTAGNKIRIILTNLDTRENDTFLRTNPHVLPVLSTSFNTIYIGGKEGSYIELPLKE